jgi:hypothetical protein
VFRGNLVRLDLLRHHGREVDIPLAAAEKIVEKPGTAAQAV